MTWQQWVTVLGSGAIAALIGLGGAVGVYLLGRLGERKRTAEVVRDEAVVQVQVAARSVVRSLLRWRPSRMLESVTDLDLAVHRFVASQHARHPNVCDWVIDRAKGLGDAASQQLRHRPFSLQKHSRTVVERSNELCEALTLWQMKERDDGWFADSTAREAAAEKK